MVKRDLLLPRVLLLLTAILLVVGSAFAVNVKPRPLTSTKPKSKSVTESQRARKKMGRLAKSRAPRTRVARRRHRRYYERFNTSSFAEDAADGDITAGEDPIVRRALIDALGNLNGTVVAIEPTSGRILAMVNQKLALSSGAQPCSTIKLSDRPSRAQRRRDRQRNPNSSGSPQPHEPDHRSRPLQQSVLRSRRTQTWLRQDQLLRPPVRAGRIGRLPDRRRTDSVPIRRRRFPRSWAA